MNHFYLNINIRDDSRGGKNLYQGIVLAGVSFRDQKGHKVKISNHRRNYALNELIESTTSLVCGRETNLSSGWMSIGGPIKGFYVIINGADDY